jgi:hypothetical protein
MSFVSFKMLTSHYKSCLAFKVCIFIVFLEAEKARRINNVRVKKTYPIEMERLHLRVFITSINNSQFQIQLVIQR